MAADPFRVLVVCTANICRSPAAAGLLRAALQDAESITVSSAGTHATKGNEMAVAMQEALPADLSPGASEFRSVRLTVSMIEKADLILAMTRAHRSEVVTLCPSAVRKAFTLREFARLLEDARSAARLGGPTGSDSTSDALRHVREVVCRGRGMVPAPGVHDDIQDPPRMSRRECRKVFESISRSAEPIATALEEAARQHERELHQSTLDRACISTAV